MLAQGSTIGLANWVAKTHHLLVSQLGLDVGAGAYVDLPAHWISVVPILGALSAGLTIGTHPDTACSRDFGDASTLDGHIQLPVEALRRIDHRPTL